MENIFIHIGYPKTGTTFLQEKVFPTFSNVKYIGKSNSINHAIYSKLYEYVFFRKDIYFNDLVKYFKKVQEKNLLISEEDFIFNSLRFSQHSDSIHYLVSLKRILNIFNELDISVKIIVTKRSLVELLKSVYSQSYTNFYSLSKDTNNFNDFINRLLVTNETNSNWRNFLDAINNDKLIEDLKELIPAENIIVNNYIDFKENPQNFINSFFGKHYIFKKNKLDITNIDFNNKTNTRSNKNSKDYKTNDNLLFNKLLNIKNVLFPNLKIKSKSIKKKLMKIKIGKSKTINLSISNEQERLLIKKLSGLPIRNNEI